MEVQHKGAACPPEPQEKVSPKKTKENQKIFSARKAGEGGGNIFSFRDFYKRFQYVFKGLSAVVHISSISSEVNLDTFGS